MGIQEIHYRPVTRNLVGFFEEDPPEAAISSLPTYNVRRVNERDLDSPRQLAEVAAVVFRQRAEKPNKVKRDLDRFAKRLLCHDCRILVEILPAHPEAKTQRFQSLPFQAIEKNELPVSGLTSAIKAAPSSFESKTDPLTPTIHVWDLPDNWQELVSHLQTYPPGQPPSVDLEICYRSNQDIEPSRKEERDTLIRRAFHDCMEVIFVETLGGLSDVQTYRVYAKLKNDYVGNNVPYEFFVKIGDRQKVAKEFLAYRNTALEHIPFHLGPRLRLDRCALGVELGIIVSDYVSGAESLSACARDGRAVPVIASLFNTTLRAWRDNASEERYSLHTFLGERMPEEIPTHRKESIQAIGATNDPTELKKLLKSVPNAPVRVGVIHGDLHALNVFVRGGDAILIDFEKVEDRAPLLLDYASIEAGLLVSGFVGDERTERELIESIASLYKNSALVNFEIEPCHPSDKSAWFADCVGQIRMQARQIECAPGQYGFTLAATLAKKSCNPEQFDKNSDALMQGITAEGARAIAYVLAENVLTALSTIGGDKSTK